MTRNVDEAKLSRRAILGHATRAALAVPAAAALGALAACGAAEEERPAPSGSAPEPQRDPAPERGSPEAAPSEAAPQAPAEASPPSAAEPSASEGGGEKLVTEIPANQGQIEALAYVNETPNAQQRCANCQLYTEVSAGRGRCALFRRGLVAEEGWCRSWVQKAG